MRTDKHTSMINKLQAALGLGNALAVLKAALKRARCPKCGSALRRTGSTFECSAPECNGLADLQGQIRALMVEAK